ncbi:MAG: hypothetical protein JSR77_15100 [Planctomycetes bacterium]|nr:hypothetical protein [Planctomycetota bacterium]
MGQSQKARADRPSSVTKSGTLAEAGKTKHALPVGDEPVETKSRYTTTHDLSKGIRSRPVLQSAIRERILIANMVLSASVSPSKRDLVDVDGDGLLMISVADAKEITAFARAAATNLPTAERHSPLPKYANEPAEDLRAMLAWAALSSGDEAYGAAQTMLLHLKFLASAARADSCPVNHGKGDDWCASTFALAFIAWYDLTNLLTPDLRRLAGGLYPVGSAAIRLGSLRPTRTVIEAVSDELGTVLRNAVYLGRRTPFDPDREDLMKKAQRKQAFGWGREYERLLKHETHGAIRSRVGIRSWEDAVTMMSKEWKAMTPDQASYAWQRLRCEGVDFGELEVLLSREAQAVLSQTEPVAGGSKDLMLPATVSRRKMGMSREEANERAKEILRKDKSFGDRNIKEWAAAIGCATGTVANLPLWRACIERRRRNKSASRPKAVSLSKGLEASLERRGKVGSRIANSPQDEELENLIADQNADERRDTQMSADGLPRRWTPRENKRV